MEKLITTTFTTTNNPSYIKLAEHFQLEVGFFDMDIEKYPDQEAWTVSITYPCEYASEYAEKLKTWRALDLSAYMNSLN